jgi:hypothetical protein
MEQVHRRLQQNAPQWAALRPSWFMQNFSEGQHLASIRDEDAIFPPRNMDSSLSSVPMK